MNTNPKSLIPAENRVDRACHAVGYRQSGSDLALACLFVSDTEIYAPNSKNWFRRNEQS